MGVGHVMQCDMCHICDETSGVGPGLGRLRDGSGTEGGMSHNREGESSKVRADNLRP